MAKIIPMFPVDDSDEQTTTIDEARDAAHTDPEIAAVLKALHAEFDDSER